MSAEPLHVEKMPRHGCPAAKLHPPAASKAPPELGFRAATRQVLNSAAAGKRGSEGAQRLLGDVVLWPGTQVPFFVPVGGRRLGKEEGEAAPKARVSPFSVGGGSSHGIGEWGRKGRTRAHMFCRSSTAAMYSGNMRQWRSWAGER